MSRPLFVSLDGPKGTGKTTLLEAVTQLLRADKQKVIRLSEQKSDPYRAETMALVNTLVRNPSRELELRVCERFADSRAWISRHVLAKQPAGSIILIDRWYPSDAAFRRIVGFADILQLNIDRNVQVPDLHVGVVTAPDISWARAAERRRGLSSTVMHKLEEHVACTQAFERAISDHGWVLCRNETTIEDATAQVVSEIYSVLRCS
jgi:thymidylate kinase